MSLRAITWALEEAPLDCAPCVLVLVGLANHVDVNLVAFPSVGRLAEYARCSPRTARRHLRELEDAGLIVPAASPARLLELPADRRPTPYRIVPPRGVNLSGRTPTARRADTGGSNGRTPVSAEPTIEPTIEPSGELTLAEVTVEAGHPETSGATTMSLVDTGIDGPRFPIVTSGGSQTDVTLYYGLETGLVTGTVSPEPHDRARRAWTVVAQALGTTKPARRAYVAIVGELHEEVTGQPCPRQAWGMYGRIVATNPPADVLPAVIEALSWGAGLGDEHLDDPVAIPKYALTVIKSKGSAA